MSSSSIEDALTRRTLDFLSHLVLQILNDQLQHSTYTVNNCNTTIIAICTWWVLSSTANLFLASQMAVRPEDRLLSTTAIIKIAMMLGRTVMEKCKP